MIANTIFKKKYLHSMKALELGVLQFLVTLFLSVIIFLWFDSLAALSFAIGGSIFAVSLMVSGWAVSRIFRQKNIAWSISVIVFKYAFILYFLFYLVQTTRFSALWIGLGSLSLVVTSFSVAFYLKDVSRLEF